MRLFAAVGREIQPADVYAEVQRLTDAVNFMSNVGLAVCVLILLQIVAKFGIFGRVVRILRRVETLLNIVAAHGKLTDDKVKGIVHQTQEAIGAAAQQIQDSIPPRVAEEVKRINENAGSSGVLNGG